MEAVGNRGGGGCSRMRMGVFFRMDDMFVDDSLCFFGRETGVLFCREKTFYFVVGCSAGRAIYCRATTLLLHDPHDTRLYQYGC